MDFPDSDRCRVCGGWSSPAFRQQVLGREVSYFDCPRCGYFQTESPYWLDEAYASAINDVDTGILLRNRLNVGRVVMTLAAINQLDGRVIDHAGGYGILVRLLRDAGVDARWRDKYCENLMARGFEAEEGPCDLLTAFEVFEHLVDPVGELAAMLRQAPVVLLSTELIATEQTPPRDWWYFVPEQGQHVGFFRECTLQAMAQKLGCHVRSDGVSLHVFSRDPMPRAWSGLMRVRRLWRVIARLKLRSKTMTDFDELRRRDDSSSGNRSA